MENKENLHDKDKHSDKDLSMMDIMLKQQALLLQQFEALSKEREKAREREDEIDLTKLVPRFMKKKKNEVVENRQVQPTEFEVIETNEINNEGVTAEEKERFHKKMAGYSKKAGKKVLGASGSYIGLVWKNKWYSIGLGLVGLALGFVMYFTIEKEYSTEMVLSKGKLSNTFYNSLIEKLQTIVENEGYAQLAKKLNITIEDAEKVKGIEYKDYLILDESELEEYINDSTIVKKQNPFFKVKVSVTDVSVLAKLEAGIYNHFVTNPFVTRDRKVRKVILTNKVEKYNREIVGMDSLKYAVIGRIRKQDSEKDNYFVRPSGLDAGGAAGGIILSQDDKLEIDPMIPFQQTLAMANERDKFEEELIQLEEEFSVVDGFAEVFKPSFPRLRHVAFIAILFGLFGGIISMIVASNQLAKLRQEEV